MQTTDKSDDTTAKYQSYAVLTDTYSIIAARRGTEFFQVVDRVGLWGLFNGFDQFRDPSPQALALDRVQVFDKAASELGFHRRFRST
jgi:hypothetical protein